VRTILSSRLAITLPQQSLQPASTKNRILVHPDVVSHGVFEGKGVERNAREVYAAATRTIVLDGRPWLAVPKSPVAPDAAVAGPSGVARGLVCVSDSSSKLG
jgi:hypothetical protein